MLIDYIYAYAPRQHPANGIHAERSAPLISRACGCKMAGPRLAPARGKPGPSRGKEAFQPGKRLASRIRYDLHQAARSSRGPRAGTRAAAACQWPRLGRTAEPRECWSACRWGGWSACRWGD